MLDAGADPGGALGREQELAITDLEMEDSGGGVDELVLGDGAPAGVEGADVASDAPCVTRVASSVDRLRAFAIKEAPGLAGRRNGRVGAMTARAETGIDSNR